MAVPVMSVAPARTKFAGLAWTALILGIVGLVGSPVIIFNNLTAIAAGVGVVLGLIAVFGSRKVLALIGTALCVGAIVATVAVQQAAVDELNEQIDNLENSISQP
ncbi:MAG TPA: hypothetical protein VNP20_22525 [Nocardioidaceae bacterium]|nr:hypothetical protein [Nocardioidaceae bacterium]